MRNFFFLIVLPSFCLQAGQLYGQICDSVTPVYTVNLGGNPYASWISPSDSRDGYCCSASGNDVCVKFIITLDSAATGIHFDIASGAVPPGALYYQINCGPPIMVGEPICLDNAGPHVLTFCKPGNNPNSYSITSISYPAVQVNTTDVASPQCASSVFVTGLAASTVSWTSVPPNMLYNSYLSCISACDSPVVTPTGNFPPYVDYMVCGNAGTACATANLCDTVRASFIRDLSVTVSPANMTLCNGISTVTISALASGGSGSYQYVWSSGQTSSGITAGAGTYNVTVTDTAVCSPATATSTIRVLPPITVHAGNNVIVCADQPSVNLNGTLQNATAGLWTGGSGTFNPNNAALNAVYTPAPSEIANGHAELVLQSTANQGCPPAFDTLHITIAMLPIPTVTGTTLLCTGSTTNYASSLVAGCAYSWSVTGGTINGSTTSNSINITWGNNPSGLVTLTQTNSSGCTATNTANVVFVVPPNPVISGTGIVCQYATAQYEVLAMPGSTYSWSVTNGILVGSTTNSMAHINWNASGNGSVTVVETNSFGCSQSYLFPVMVSRKPLPLITGHQAACTSDPALTYAAPWFASTGYVWSVTGGNIESMNGINSLNIAWITAGINFITLTVTDSISGCDSTTVLPVNTGAISPAAAQASEVNGCAPLSISFIGNTPLPGQTYAWTFGDQWYSFSANPIHVYEEPGVYHPVVMTQHPGGCIDSATATITVYEVPRASFNHNFERNFYMVGESDLHLENNTVNGNSWLWTFGTGDTSNVFEPRMTYKMPGDYLIELISTGLTGCSDTTRKEIRVRNKEYIYVPNAFTPNGDKVNDSFFMLTTHIQSASISIFNRWGLFIYSSDDKDFRWDGTCNGSQAELGVYGYVINATGEGGRTYTQLGTVTLVR